jgi:glycine hydroxymethyltransferase
MSTDMQCSAVTALYKGTPRKGTAVLLRSYDSRREPPPEFDCTVWQAGRATSATGLAFKPIQIGQHVFIDEGPGTYNPAPQILDEAVVNEWPGREVGVFISVGTGKRPAGTNNRQHEWWEDFFGDALGTFAEARRRLITKIEGCEDIHNEMLRDRLAKRNVPKDNYFRLNVEVGVGEFGMNEWNRLADISTNTRQYLAKPEVKKMILDAGVRFAKIDRMNRRLANHAAAGGDRDDLSFDLETEELTISDPIQSYVPPPQHFAVELPAELPADPIDFAHQPTQAPPPIPTSVTVSPPDDSLPAHPTPHESMPTSPRQSSDGVNYRRSHDQSRPSSQQQGSPHRSDEHFAYSGPPPVPPKTPIPYPSQDEGGVAMPAPLFSQSSSNNVRPPYPVDESPPVVNRQRKPSYHVR